MSEEDPAYFQSLPEWQSWLKENHETGKSIWLVIQKKASKKPGIRYEEAVLEAVSYGWIDGKMKRLNDDEFKQRYTPRRNYSVWSLSNRNRAEKLITAGRMRPAGLRAVEEAKRNGRWEKATTSRRAEADMPDDLQEALKTNDAAYRNFQAFPPSARYMYIHWVNEAKRQATQERRINTVVDRSEKNLRAGIGLRMSKK